MALIERPELVDGVLTADDLNEIFQIFYDDYNGNITNDNVAVDADFHGSKIMDGTVTSRKLKPTKGVVRATGNVNLSTSAQDATGASVSITCDVASTCIATAFFDVQGIVSGTSAFIGYFNVDGSNQSAEAILASASGSIRATVGQTWSVSLSAGVHTLKLQAKVQVDTGTEQLNTTHTGFSYDIFAQ